MKNILKQEILSVLVTSTAIFVASQQVSAQNDKPVELEEVIVTATKRAQSIQDTAMSISALDGESLIRSRRVELNEFLPSIPSVSFIDFGGGRNTLIVRGLTAQPQLEDKVVGTYFGEANISQLGNVSGGAAGSANLKMVDIERVELLRGPQGTLWGAGSMGGTLRILPKAPDLSEFSGELTVSFSETAEYGEGNSNQHAVVNIPIVENSLGIRLVGYHYEDSGYVRNIAASDDPKIAASVLTGAPIVNKDHIGATSVDGFRASALWQASDNLEISLLHAYQDSKLDGRPEINLTLGDYQQSRWDIPGIGGESLTDEFSLTTLKVEWDLGFSTLTSATSYVNQVSHTDRNFLGTFWEYNPTVVINDIDNESLIQEFRLVSNSSNALQYVVGFYYEKFEQDRDDVVDWLGTVESNIFDPNGSNSLGSFKDFNQIKEKAVFGEVTYHFSDRFSATLGGRYFDYDKSFIGVFPIKGVFNIGLPEPDTSSVEESNQTYKASAKYNIHEDLMVYAQWAEGFRLGAAVQPWPDSCDADNDGLHDELGLPRTTQIDSDDTTNYELGLKWDVNGQFVINAAIFRTDWQGLPVSLGRDSECGFGVVINGGEAQSEGIEADGSWQLNKNIRVDFGLSYLNAELVTDVDNVGVAGDRLPGAPEFSASLGASFGFEILDKPSVLKLDYLYVGGFYGAVGTVGEEAGNYHVVDANAEVQMSEQLHFNLFVKNLTNNDALTWVDFFPPNGVQMRPRVIGFDIRYAF